MGAPPCGATSCWHCWCPSGLPTLLSDEALLLLDAVLGQVVLDESNGLILVALLLNELFGCRSIRAAVANEDVDQFLPLLAITLTIMMYPLNLFSPKKFSPIIMSSVWSVGLGQVVKPAALALLGS